MDAVVVPTTNPSMRPQVEELESKLHMYIMSVLAHFRSNWTELKGTAALLVGKRGMLGGLGSVKTGLS